MRDTGVPEFNTFLAPINGCMSIDVTCATSKHDTMIQCRADPGPPPATLVRNHPNTESFFGETYMVISFHSFVVS